MTVDPLLSLPFEQQIGQFFFIGLPGTDLDDTARSLIDEVQPGGVIIFGRNVVAPEQLRSLLDDVSERLANPPLFGIDQEGGLVDRLRKIFTPMPAARTIRQHGDLAAARTLGRITGEVLRMLGFNINFARANPGEMLQTAKAAASLQAAHVDGRITQDFARRTTV